MRVRPQKEELVKNLLRLASAAAVAALASFSLAAGGAVTASATTGSARIGNGNGNPVYFGVSAAETGPYAQYGDQFKEAFTLAADQVNAKGGIDGHPVELKYEDSQSDPTQSVTVAQNFVSDSSVILVFGDYSSAASIPASPIYTAGKLVQYGFNNSDPDFTAKGSEYQWSSSETTNESYTWTADYIHSRGIKSVGVTYLDTSDWGVPAFASFRTEANKVGLKITDAEAVDDYRPALIKATAGKPQDFVHIGYGPDAAEIVSQLRAIGYKGTFYGGQDVAAFDDSPSAQGSIAGATFIASSTQPRVKAFVKEFEKAYPNAGPVTSFEAGAYDALNVAVAAAKKGGTTRAGVLKGFKEIKDVPSVVYGTITFSPDTRRVQAPQLTPTILKDDVWIGYGA
jgi:branched-chain amino acid transport system substrate-binding protein